MKISHWPGHLPNNAEDVYPQVLEAIKHTDTLVSNDMDADAALIWSVLWFGKMGGNKRVWEHYRSQGKPVIVIEVGGLIRNKTWKLGINGINRDADFAVNDYEDDSRLNKLDLMPKSWKQEGEYILVCGQHGHSEQWRDMPEMGEYFKQTVLDIRAVSDKPIVLRSHPRYRENLHFTCDMEWFAQQGCVWNIPKHIQQTYDSFDLEHMLKHTYCVYSHSSNAGINSILQGVPAVVSPHSLAWDVGSYSVERLRRAPRHNWLNRLCYTEWYADEIHIQWNRIRSKM